VIFEGRSIRREIRTMRESTIIHEIAEKGSDIGKLAERVVEAPGLLTEIFEGLNSTKARERYGCEKTLRIISQKKPEILYPRFDSFVQMLDRENNLLKWGAIITIANLASVDTENRIERVFNKYFSPIPGPIMITAANVIRGAAKIALAKPGLTERITKEILKVEKAQYRTPECRNIALGHAINSFDQFFHQIKDKDPVIKLIKKQRKNSRDAVRKKAEKFLNKHGRAS